MNLTIEYLQQQYGNGTTTPRKLIAKLLELCKADSAPVWISLLNEEELEPYFHFLEQHDPADLPLYGIPFAIKDNIDLAGIPTTAGCPEYAYTPEASAFVVQQLTAAGAVPLGKTNLDQFATGLVGTRSPYGACPNSFHSDYISGGSSSGSAVAVAKGYCTFSLGTDTAGSGRVPAAFNNLLGIKPSRGLLSCTGVIPACRTLDCVSIFALCADDGVRIFDVASTYDPADAYSRRRHAKVKKITSSYFKYGVPQKKHLQFFNNREYEAAFATSLELLNSLGGELVEIDFEPFLHAAKLLYEGPWVEERKAAVGEFLQNNPQTGDPVVRKIVCIEKQATAEDLFKACYRLQELKRKTDTILESIDVLVTPTAGTCYTIEEVMNDPIALNSNLGYYTNYMNLLDYCGLAVPTAMTKTVPFGVTLVGRSFADKKLLSLGAQLHAKAALPMGCGSVLPAPSTEYNEEDKQQSIQLAVCGAHLKGFPLHHQLVDLDATFVEKTTTSPCYELFALQSEPPKPGLIRNVEKGTAIEVEIYSLTPTAFGRFVASIPHPLGIGKVELVDDRWVSGFIAEPVATEGAENITSFGGWRAFLRK